MDIDVLIELLAYVNAADYGTLMRLSTRFQIGVLEARSLVFNSWYSFGNFVIPCSLHDMLHERRIYEVYVILSELEDYYREEADSSHRSLLDLAVHMRLFNFASWLVLKGFRSNVQGDTIFDCIRSSEIRGAEILIASGIPIDRFRSRDDGLNVLTCSVIHGSPAMVEMFIANGVSIPEGTLIDAILSRHSDPCIVQLNSILLNKARCDPNSRSITGSPAIQLALTHSPFAQSIIEILISHGVNVNAPDGSMAGGYTALDIASKKRKKGCYNSLSSRGAVHSLLFAVESGDVPTIELYLRKNLSFQKKDIDYLISVASAMGRVESLKTLLDANLTDLNTVFLRNDLSPLHLAASRGHIAVCKALERAGINVNATAFGGMDIHNFASNLIGSALWFNPTELGSNGTPTGLPIRLKNAAELAREAGHEKIARMLDYAMIGSVIARKESFDSVSSESSFTRSVPGRRHQIP